VESEKCTATFNPCTFNFANYINEVKKRIELGGSNCPINITNLSEILSLETNEEIVLKP
jgi:hypothetical protein